MAKKTKKVDHPIDQRETFVSIQKNFADSDLTVEEKLKVLYNLQITDSAIDKILQLRGELPFEVESLENEVAEKKDQIAQINQKLEDLTKQMTDEKHKIAQCDTLIERYNTQLNTISNSREYDSLSKELENQGLEKQIAEKYILAARKEIGELKQNLQKMKEDLSRTNDNLKEKKSELSNIVESTAKQEKKLLADRQACASKIDARTMSAYERIRTSERNHLAVVSVFNGDSCGGCFNTIIPQRLIEIASNKKLVICEHCGRIIVSSNIGEE